MRVRISRADLEQIVTAASASKEEICGLLLGYGADIVEVRSVPNVAVDRVRHFELDPVALIAAHRAARDGGLRVLGHYHSHPSGVAAPSVTDRDCALPDGSLWMILADGQAALWRAEAGEGGGIRFRPVPLDSR